MIESSKNMKKDEAVSPVIGVMLMLVVTVIIAAVVAGFGTGLIGGLDPAPSLSATAQITSDKNITIIINGIDNVLSPDAIEVTVTCLDYDDFWKQELVFDGPIMTSSKITTPIALLSTSGNEVMTMHDDESISSGGEGSLTHYNYNALKTVYCVLGANQATQNKRLHNGAELNVVMSHASSGKAVFTKKIVYVDLFQNN